MAIAFVAVWLLGWAVSMGLVIWANEPSVRGLPTYWWEYPVNALLLIWIWPVFLGCVAVDFVERRHR